MKENLKVQIPVLAGAVLLCILAWLYLPLPKTFLQEDTPEIAAIQVCYYTNMSKVTITDEDAIAFILSELRGVSFRRSGLVFGIHNSTYNLKFLTSDGEVCKAFHLDGNSIQSAGDKYGVSMNYVPWDGSLSFLALDRYLERALAWSEDSGEPFPAPPTEEERQAPDLPTGDALAALYPFDEEQATLYIYAYEDGWLTYELSTQDIAELSEAVPVSALTAIPPAEQSGDVPDIYIDFHNGTILGGTSETSYVWFGSELKIVEDENGGIRDCALSGAQLGPYDAGESAVYFAGLSLDYLWP